jgi:hypothetical protein
MPGTQNHSLISRIFGEAFNQGNLAVIGEATTPNHLHKAPLVERRIAPQV